MANIPQFDTPALSLRPSETGVESVAGAARRIGSFYTQLASSTEEVGSFKASMLGQAGSSVGGAIKTAGDAYVNYLDHQEISHGTKTFAELQDNLTQKWNDWAKNADPNDPSTAAKFRETVLQPALDNFQSQDAFTTEKSQDWAQGHAAALQEHFTQKMSADMSTLAGIAVHKNVADSTTAMTNTAYTDPSSVPFLLESTDHSIGGIVSSSPTLSATDAARVRSEVSDQTKSAIVKAGFMGAISKSADPEAEAKKWTQKYPEYINGAEAGQFAKAAKTQAKANTLVDKQTEVAQRQIADLSVHKGATKVINDNVTFDPQTGRPIVDPKFFKQSLDIAKNNPNAPSAAETVRTMFNWGEAQQSKDAKPADDPTVKSDLMTRMFSPDNPTTMLDLQKAHAEGKISDSSFQAMHGLVTEIEQGPLKDPVFHDTINAVKGELILSNVGLPGKDINGEANYAKWAQSFYPQYLSLKRTGTLPANALDVKDPNSLISQSMAPFKRTVQQRAQDYLSTLGGGAAAGVPAPVVGGHEVPASLRGIAALQYNAAKNLWRDQTSGTIYDASGREVK